MRASGVLMPIFSLPSPYGIGAFSKEAYEFVDQLAKAGQRYWQILPMGPRGSATHPMLLTLPLPEIRILLTWKLWWKKAY